MKKKIAFIGDVGAGIIDDWHHYGFWFKTLKECDRIEVTHYNRWQEVPEEYDFYFFIDYKQDQWTLPDDKYRPRVLFWWDAFHHMFSITVQLALVFDMVYVAEYLDAEHAQMAGFKNTQWLPGAFYPGLYKPLVLEKQHNIGFVGQLNDFVRRKGLTRKTALEQLVKKFGGDVRWDLRGPGVNELYNRSNLLWERSIFANIGTRLFETVGSGGAMVLMNRFPCNNGLDQIGEDGVHFVTYDETLEDMLEKANHYLLYPEEREKIRLAGYAHFLENHTYRHRMEKIFMDFGI